MMSRLPRVDLLVAVTVVLAVPSVGCIRDPNMDHMKCTLAKGCPSSYVCTETGGGLYCRRPTVVGPAADAATRTQDGPSMDAPDTRPSDGADVSSIDAVKLDVVTAAPDVPHAEAVGRDVDSPDADKDVPGADALDSAGDGESDVPQVSVPDGGAGGVRGTGGVVGSGGATSSGGAIATGGVVANGGTVGSGGVVGTGGVGTGGIISSGGVPGTGGTVGTGGIISSGGVPGTGGMVSTGGTIGTGGVINTGGNPGTGGGTATVSSGCGHAPTIPSSQYNNGTSIPITAGGLDRRYILSVPTNYDNNKSYKLVIALHSLDGNDRQVYQSNYYGLSSLSGGTTIFVAPNGQRSGAPCAGTGSGESGCGWPNTGGTDMALMDAIVAQLNASFCIDKNQIFATGWSYGASMSYEIGCQRPVGGTAADWGVRGIAISSGGQLSGSCQPDSAYPVAYYASHGTHDSVLRYEAGLTLAQKWSAANGCTWQTPTEVTSGEHVCTKMVGCNSGYPVEFCSFNGDHTPYPDNGSASDTWGPQEAWTFLSQF